MRTVFCLLFLFYSVTSQAANVLTCKVERVIDGDTVIVVVDDKQVRVRLEGIDAPEMDQPFEREAKAALEVAVDGRVVYVYVKERDKCGRTIGTILGGSKDLSARMVMLGFA